MSRDDLWAWNSHRLSAPATLKGFLRFVSLLAASIRGDAFLLFVEDASLILNVVAIEAPDGSAITALSPIPERKSTRYRGSGIGALRFVVASLAFEDLTVGDIDAVRRERRRRSLLRLFRGRPLRSFDLYVSPGDDQAGAIAEALVPTSWYMIVLERGVSSPRRLVYHSPTGAAEDGIYEAASLRWIVPVPAWLENRLRDIFSLNHVRDARLGRGLTESGPGGTPPPEDRPEERGYGWEVLTGRARLPGGEQMM